MRVPAIAAASLLAAASGACGAVSIGPGDGAPVPISRLGSGAVPFLLYSGLRSSERLVVHDAASWQQVWTRMWRHHTPEPPLPVIDFTKESIIVVALGERPTGGFTIVIDAAYARGADLEVDIRATSPHRSCVVTLALTQPVDVVRVPKVEGRVVFDERADERRCE